MSEICQCQNGEYTALMLAARHQKQSIVAKIIGAVPESERKNYINKQSKVREDVSYAACSLE